MWFATTALWQQALLLPSDSIVWKNLWIGPAYSANLLAQAYDPLKEWQFLLYNGSVIEVSEALANTHEILKFTHYQQW